MRRSNLLQLQRNMCSHANCMTHYIAGVNWEILRTRQIHNRPTELRYDMTRSFPAVQSLRCFSFHWRGSWNQTLLKAIHLSIHPPIYPSINSFIPFYSFVPLNSCTPFIHAFNHSFIITQNVMTLQKDILRDVCGIILHVFNMINIERSLSHFVYSDFF